MMADETQLGQNQGSKSLAQRKADAAALMAVAREAGMAVQADDFGRGTYLFSTVDVLERLLHSARRIAVAAERARWTEAVMAELDGNGQAHAIVAYATRA